VSTLLVAVLLTYLIVTSIKIVSALARLLLILLAIAWIVSQT
jgi:hypothetical protein